MRWGQKAAAIGRGRRARAVATAGELGRGRRAVRARRVLGSVLRPRFVCASQLRGSLVWSRRKGRFLRTPRRGRGSCRGVPGSSGD
jgi:hypothetical protein